MNIETPDVVHQGQIITNYRKAKKWSQEDLAEALYIDVRTVQRMEKQAMIKSADRRRLLIGLLGIPAELLGLEDEQQRKSSSRMAVNSDRMAFFEDEMTTRWEMYYVGGTLRSSRGLDLWIQEIARFTRSAQGTTWHERTMALLAMSYQLQSCVYRDSSNYTQAHEAYQKALRIAKELNDPELIASAYAREGVTLIQQERPKEAISHLQGALSTLDHLGLSSLRGYTLQALSEAYSKNQQAQDAWRSIGLAERVLEKGELVPERSISRFNASSVLAQKGVNAVLLNDYDRAIMLIEKSLIKYDPSYIRGRARLLAQKAEAYYGQGFIDLSTATAEDALNLAQSVGSSKTMSRVKNLHTSLSQSQWRKERSIARLGAVLSATHEQK